MRFRTLLLASALLMGAQGFAQNSNFNGLNYQAVVRNSSGDPLPNQAIGVQFVVSCGSLQPYIESHAVTSDATGLITLSIGQGTPQFGSSPFTSIDWAGCGQWEWSLNVAMDLAGGTNYQVVGAMPFKAVPFALNAASLVNPPQTGWVVTGNDVFKNNGGNVGIGTGIPTAKLDVAGTFKLVDGSQGANKVLTSDADGLATWVTPSSGGTGWSLSGNNLLNTNSGNVGIGTTTATDKLTVRTATSNYGFTHTDGTITLGSFVGGTSGGGWLGTKSNHKLHFFTNNAVAQMTLATDGSVGIGTTTPAQKLDVNGSIQCAGHLVFNAANGVLDYGPGGALYIRSLATQGNIASYTDRMVIMGTGNVGIGSSTPEGKLSVQTSSGSSGESAMLVRSNGGSTECMVVRANGNVGIGTITPQSRLAVNGKITCKEVEVTLAGFPDYVFEKDYRLMSLAEVEAYIAANGHLPNVPSACEVEENGLGLGEMNKILLEKVEELTLHAIEREKQMQQVLQRLLAAEESLNQLKD